MRLLGILQVAVGALLIWWAASAIANPPFLMNSVDRDAATIRSVVMEGTGARIATERLRSRTHSLFDRNFTASLIIGLAGTLFALSGVTVLVAQHRHQARRRDA
jgi:hypothetical protein